jgi:hypothetical protein
MDAPVKMSPMRMSKFRILAASAIAALAVAIPTAIAAAQTPSAALPGGMANYTVAVGKVDAASRANWQRLGTYVFAADGTVSEKHWHWSQKTRVTRSSTGVTASGCPSRKCVVQTAHGYPSASDALHGTYTTSGDTLKVAWDGGLWEEWTVSQAIAGKLAKLTFSASSFGATHGFGYGSNASLDTRASMKDIAAVDGNSLKHEFYLWKTDPDNKPYIDTGHGNPFWLRKWTVCDSGTCMGGETGNPTEYYVSPPNTTATDRRDTLWHWVRKLADDRHEYCYTGNSHVKPMLQIIDSDGKWHGWVGVEASLSQTSSGTNADDVGVFQISAFAA